MTKIIVQKTKNGTYRGFSCDGHAGFDKIGEDIVCAAISILVINTINSMEELADEDLEITSDEAEGMIGCKFRQDPSVSGKLLMDSMILGLSCVETQYGKKYITLKFEEV